jgi:catabolite regulation protein CreA
MYKLSFSIITILVTVLAPNITTANDIGSVDTKFNLLSPDDSIKIEVLKTKKLMALFAT